MVESIAKVTIANLDELGQYAKQLSDRLRPGDAVALIGEMGVGKTTLVRAVMKAWGYEDPVVSPTYPIVVEYELNSKAVPHVIHIDGYRLEPHQPLPFDPFEWKSRPSIVFVEWPERLNLPEKLLNRRLVFERSVDSVRTIREEID